LDCRPAIVQIKPALSQSCSLYLVVGSTNQLMLLVREAKLALGEIAPLGVEGRRRCRKPSEFRGVPGLGQVLGKSACAGGQLVGTVGRTAMIAPAEGNRACAAST